VCRARLFVTGQVDRVRLGQFGFVHDQHLRKVAERIAHVVDVERDQVVERTGFFRREIEFGWLARLDVVDVELLPQVLRLGVVDGAGPRELILKRHVEVGGLIEARLPLCPRASRCCLLDDVVVGKQEMVGAIDAVCDVAQRIIGKLTEGATAGGPVLLGVSVGNGAAAYPPTPAMKRFADSLSRQKGIKPPPGYKTSILICRKFLSEHAPKKADNDTAGKLHPKPVSPAQLLYAKKIAQGRPHYPR
jgi:hypothetical protein